ncbi:MAG: zinc ribbon domain-containing protein [Candidatus Moranbacteria bacterium]|nr:zinc ribbon domain-containing protein [Candidatus Moranbacteria bacterium]
MEQQSPGPTKKCPKCGEDILKSAKRCKHCQADLRGWINRHPILTIILIFLGIIFFPFLMAGISSDTSQAPEQTNKAIKTESKVAAPAGENKAVEASVNRADESKNQDPLSRIESLAGSVGDFEVTLWDTKQNFAKAATPPPYEVIVNAGNGKISSCYNAKVVAFDLMKKLYTDGQTKDKISRVLFTSWGNLRVSVGSDDGVKTDWKSSGPTNFWTVMMKYKSYEDETGPMSQRTWGKAIANDCD